MARRRPGSLLLLLLLLAIVGGTVSVLVSGGPPAPLLGGPHRIERRAASAFPGEALRSPGAVPAAPTVSSEVLCPADVLVRVVRARDEKPIAGARVSLVDLASCWTGVADDRGEVRYSGVESGAVSLLAYAEGYSEARLMTALHEGANPEVVLRLGESPLVEGRVVSAADGKPIPGAEVRAGPHAGAIATGTSPPSAITDGEGAFRLRAGEEGQSLYLSVRAKGFVPKDHWFPLPAKADAGASVEIALDPTGLLRGVVRDPAGRPVAGAEVVAFPSGAPYRTNVPMDSQPRADTDGEGAYALEGLARGGLYRVTADASGFAPSEEMEVFLPEGDAETRADFDLRPAGNILVKWSVEGLQNGGMASVTLHDPGNRAALSSAWGGGSARFTEIAAGRYQVALVSSMQGSAPVEVRAGETVTVEIPLSAAEAVEGAFIEGVVTDSRGSPVARASVSAIPADAETPGSPDPPVPTTDLVRGKVALIMGRIDAEIPGRGTVVVHGWASTDAEGRFRVRVQKEGLRYRLTASTPSGFAPLSEPVTAPATGIALVLTALGRVKGRLVPPAGAAHPRMFDIRVEGAEGPPRIGSVAMGGFASGSFETQPLLPGRQRLAAVAGEFLLPPREIEVRAGETLDLGDLALEPGVMLTGRVVDPAGRGVAQAVLSLGGLFRTTAVSGIGGRVEAGPLPAGEASLSLSLARGISVTRTVAVPPDGQVGDLLLPKGGILRVRAAGAGGRPFPAAIEVRTAAPGADAWWGRTDHMGRYSVTLPPGEYQVAIHDTEASDRVTAEARAVLAEGAETKVDLKVVR